MCQLSLSKSDIVVKSGVRHKQLAEGLSCGDEVHAPVDESLLVCVPGNREWFGAPRFTLDGVDQVACGYDG